MLTDGTHIVSYQQVSAILAHINKFMRAKFTNTSPRIVFECNNSIPDALFLLHLFSKGYDFALYSDTAVDNEIPSFCEYRIKIKNASTCHLDIPEQYLDIVENKTYLPTGTYTPSCGRLYMKTSGSTGNSKIVLHSHEKFFAMARNGLDSCRLTKQDRVAIPVPIFHLYGLGSAFIPAILAGASINIQNNPNILTYLEQERKWKPNVAFLTPTLCKMLLKGRRTSKAGYRLIVTAGDKIQEAVFREVDHRLGTLINIYGSTEMGAILASPIDNTVDDRVIHTGKPMAGVSFQVRNQNQDGVGNLYCLHRYGFNGYADENGEPINRQTHNSWYNMGDLATQDSDGHVTILGRSGNSVNRNGFLVLFSDIEKGIDGLDGIEQTKVLSSAEETKYGKKIVAFCKLSTASDFDADAIRNACRKVLPDYMIPDEVHILDAFPMLPSGKIDGQKLLTTVKKN